jgi:DNA-binding GntR family transcriptional regulator
MSIDRGAPEELHLQLAEILRAQIESGELPPRSKLPPQLDMVQQYGISRGTVARATGLLADEGLVRWVKGRGLYTAEPDAIAAWKRERSAERKKRS